MAIALDVTIAAIAHAAGASRTFSPLQPASYTSLTVIGMLAGTAGWAVVRAKAADPRRMLGRLVPGVLVISLVPDAIAGTSSARGSQLGCRRGPDGHARRCCGRAGRRTAARTPAA